VSLGLSKRLIMSMKIFTKKIDSEDYLSVTDHLF
jgi:hypothetical protein